MLNGSSWMAFHRAQNAALLSLSFAMLPLDTFVLVLSYVMRLFGFVKQPEIRRTFRESPSFQPRKVLITGVGMTKGLMLARSLFEAGHDVIGADFEVEGSMVCGSVSRSLKKFYSLRSPQMAIGSTIYAQELLEIVKDEQIELWISCSGVASALEDGEAKEAIERKTACKAIQFDVNTIKTLHEKNSFIELCSSIGLFVPETSTVTSREDALKILETAPEDRRYIMKPIGVDDANRADMTLLPRATLEETITHISNLDISEKRSWILQQHIDGSEYCTHALVVRGQVRAFVACPSSELLMHYKALPIDSPESQAMLEFTKTVANHGGHTFTGHLSFDFLITTKQRLGHEEVLIYPIECNPRAHTAVTLFNGDAELLAAAYMSIFDKKDEHNLIVTPTNAAKYYWSGHDLVTLFIIPIWSLLLLRISLFELSGNLLNFINHVLFWRDGTYELWDPLPWWWLYHIYWPMQFWTNIRSSRKWSRINVSTTKVFRC